MSKVCSYPTYAIRNIKTNIRPMAFAQWGMDIVGPLPAAPAQKKFLLIATDYFSKWVEAEAYASIQDKDVTKFVWKNIVCRFGIPQTIIADNGPQFDSIAFRIYLWQRTSKLWFFTFLSFQLLCPRFLITLLNLELLW